MYPAPTNVGAGIFPAHRCSKNSKKKVVGVIAETTAFFDLGFRRTLRLEDEQLPSLLHFPYATIQVSVRSDRPFQ